MNICPKIDGIDMNTNAFQPDQRDFYDQILEYGLHFPGNVDTEFLRLAESGQLRVRLLNSRSFNASAGGTKEKGYDIELNVSVPPILHFLFNVAMRVPGVFGYIDDDDEEPYRDPSVKRPIPLALPEGLSIIEACETLPSVSRPRSDRRALVASKLAELACGFCMFHEVGHVVAGHTPFAMTLCSSDSICELSESGESNTLLQVCEREADLIAIMQLASILISPSEHRDHFRACFELEEEEDESIPYHMLSIALFSVRILFLYLGQFNGEIKTKSLHPHPLVRATYVHSALRIMAIEDLGLDVEILDEMLDNAADQSSAVWHELGLEVPALNGDQPPEWYSTEVAVEVERLVEKHEQLYETFTATSWLPLDSWTESSLND